MFSEPLNLRFQWEIDRPQNVRLLRPYLPDGTPIPTELEGHYLRMEEQHLREVAEARAEAETQRRQEAEAELERLRAQLANRQNEEA